MNILFLGNFEVDYSSESHYKKTFEKLGHAVLPLQEGKAKAINMMNILEAVPVDMFFWVHTHGWITPGIVDILDECRKRGIPSVAYHLDLYMGIQRERQFFNSAYSRVEHFFTVDKLMADHLNMMRSNAGFVPTIAHGHFLPAGVFEDECYLGTPDHNKYPHEIVFTGSKGYHPEWPYRPQLIDWLHDTYGNRFGHYGGGGLPSLRGAELNNLYASAKVVIGDTLCKDFTYPYYSSDRLFEVAGRGGCLIYPRIKGLDDFYDGGVRWYDFNDFTGLKTEIDYLCENDALREITRAMALERTLAEHTYTHRLQTLIGTVELHTKNKK